MLTEAKPFWQSKTLWFNVLTLLVLLAEQTPAIWDAVGVTLPDWVTVAIVYVLIIGNFLLRVITKEPIKFSLK